MEVVFFFLRVCVRVLIAYCDDGKSGFGWGCERKKYIGNREVVYIYAWMNE